MTRIRLAICAAAVLLVSAGCGAESGGEHGAGWQRLPDSPLSPREAVTTHWTGDEVLLLGGSDARPCPPSADCYAPETAPLADGAAFDLGTKTWRTIADAPVPFEFARTVQIGDTVYVATPGNDTRPDSPPAFLAYDVAGDRWMELPLPLGAAFEGEIIGAGDRVVSFSRGDDFGEQPDSSFDPATGAWSELPDDPLPPSFDRAMAWNGTELVLLAHEIPNPSGEDPPLGAAFDPAKGSWRELSASELHEIDARYTIDAKLVGPGLTADETLTDAWPKLSHPPAGQEDFGNGPFATALFGEADAYFFDYGGWAFDAFGDGWLEVPLLDSEEIDLRSYVSAGNRLLAFNGIDWDGFDGTFLNETWMWSPPAASPG